MSDTKKKTTKKEVPHIVLDGTKPLKFFPVVYKEEWHLAHKAEVRYKLNGDIVEPGNMILIHGKTESKEIATQVTFKKNGKIVTGGASVICKV